eukprot:CAMPEP_0197844910 /NCGR_PEP_ID=MMETSP1438-20131217/1888_1 /TAXON_ID=1461541 /ORGANISM="Pterosperma sp., Strain CCMP1384" /LENGTH=186 /DNA_ID=CAMNT_0043455949 /DNA_START=118 /DNA_END=675 /DNA_ORIENTATION=+
MTLVSATASGQHVWVRARDHGSHSSLARRTTSGQQPVRSPSASVLKTSPRPRSLVIRASGEDQAPPPARKKQSKKAQELERMLSDTPTKPKPQKSISPEQRVAEAQARNKQRREAAGVKDSNPSSFKPPKLPNLNPFQDYGEPKDDKPAVPLSERSLWDIWAGDKGVLYYMNQTATYGAGVLAFAW